MGIRGLKKAWICLGLTLITAAGYVVSCSFGPLPPGTSIGGISCSGLSKRELAAFLEKELDFSARTVEITPPQGTLLGGTMKVPLGAPYGLGIVPDVESTVKSLGLLYGPLSRPKAVPLVITVDEERWASAITAISRFFEIPPKDASWEILPGDRVVVIPDEPGYRVDAEELRRRVVGDFRWSCIPVSVEVPLVEVRAAVTKEKLEAAGIDGVIVAFSTRYQDNCDRAHNVALAARDLDGAVIWPGEVISFNEKVGPRLPERGYRKAPIYVGTRLEDDYGGGVCQVSSTLYGALLRAGFEVVERHNHGMPVDYLPMGEDATVAYGLLDLKMRNVLAGPVVVKAYAEGGVLTVKVFGRREPLKEIKIETSVVRELGGDEPGSKRWVVRTRRIFLYGGTVVEVEDLGTSVYTSLPKKGPAPSL